MKAILREWIVRPWLHPAVARRFTPLVRNRVAVLMLHRFADPKLGNRGFDPARLRRYLELLKREGFRMLSLEQVLDAVRGEGPPLSRCVCFTVDDAYADFVTAGAPIFHELEVPVALFVPTGFVDGLYWPWWNRLEYAFLHTHRTELLVEPRSGEPLALSWAMDSRLERISARRRLAEALKGFSAAIQERWVGEVSRKLEVDVPERPPREYRPATWDQLRECGKSGVTLAPHSVSHRSLAHCDPNRARWEVEESLARLRKEIGHAPPVFAFPYGLSDHSGQGTEAGLREAGLEAAFTAMPGYVRRGSDAPFRLPRFSCPEGDDAFTRIVFGLERLRRPVRPS